MRRGRDRGKLTGQSVPRPNITKGIAEFQPVEYVEGPENPAEFPNVIWWLVALGNPDEQIAKVVGGNALRALREARV